MKPACQSRKLKSLLFTTVLLMLVACHVLAQSPEKDDRLNWWRDARFGLFIHWGLYAIPAGEWGGQTNYGEWIRNNAQIPLATYDKFLQQFNPVKFNAEEWVLMAKNAGMKYIVITSKHHDGFALFDSKVSDFDVMATPFKRDILKELAAACKKHDMTLCFYHSIMDWHHPDYLPRREWEKDRPVANANFERYVAYMKEQLKELLTNYGNIGVLWFDGEWEGTWTHERGKDLYQFVRSLQPSIIINNRVDVGREGMQGLTKEGGFVGDFGTPEQEIPATGIPGSDWESCMTMNGNWGYNKNDNNWKSSEDLVQKLIDIASKGGNFLLNVGPAADGTFPPASVERLSKMGEWMKVNGESIYGTKASPFKMLTWGRCTQKNINGNTRLYLHVFDATAKQIVLPGLGSEVQNAYLLAGNSKVPFTRKDNDYVFDLSRITPQQFATTIAIDCKGEAIVYTEPQIKAPTPLFIDQLPVIITTDIPQSTIRYTTNGTEPTTKSFVASQPIYINQTTTIKAKVFLGENAVSPTATASYNKAIPLAAKNTTANNTGLKYAVYDGKWNKLPDFSQLKPAISGSVKDFDISARQGKEAYGYVFEGWIKVPADGVYTFYVSSDDGSRLWIDDVLIDNDGSHALTEKSATIPLSKGYHAIKLHFFENSGGDELHVSWKGPGFEKTAIPGSVLFFQ